MATHLAISPVHKAAVGLIHAEKGMSLRYSDALRTMLALAGARFQYHPLSLQCSDALVVTHLMIFPVCATTVRLMHSDRSMSLRHSNQILECISYICICPLLYLSCTCISTKCCCHQRFGRDRFVVQNCMLASLTLHWIAG